MTPASHSQPLRNPFQIDRSAAAQRGAGDNPTVVGAVHIRSKRVFDPPLPMSRNDTKS